MRFFAIITLISAFLLAFGNTTEQKRMPRLSSSTDIHGELFKKSFTHPQNANIAWAMISGEKKGISPNLLKDFKALDLLFFFSPSGIHLSAILLLFFFLINKLTNKKTSRILKFGFLIGAYFLPFLAIKRIVILRLLIILKRSFKYKISIEILFFTTFIISFFLGHYQASPMGFIMSFLYIGTFLAFSDQSRVHLFLVLCSSHLLIVFFNGAEFSFLATLLSLPCVAMFSFLLPFIYLNLGSFHFLRINWIEIVIRYFILMIHWSAKLTIGSFMSASFFLLIAIWIILFKQKKRYLLIALLLHGNALQAPMIIVNQSKLAQFQQLDEAQRKNQKDFYPINETARYSPEHWPLNA